MYKAKEELSPSASKKSWWGWSTQTLLCGGFLEQRQGIAAGVGKGPSPCLENTAGHHTSHHQFSSCLCCLMSLSQHRKKTQKCPSGNAQITILRARLPFIPTPAHLMMWNCWSTAPLPQGPSDPWTSGPEKSLQDCNHKWITADTRVPDGGKEISTCINEEETLWAVYQVIKKIKRVVWLKYKIKKKIYIYTHHWQLQAFFAVTEATNTNKIEQHRHIISLWWVWVVVGFWLVGLGLRNFLPLFYKWWCYSKATQETLAWEKWPVREHKILLRQHHSPGTQQGRGWAGGLVENWQCDHGTAHWARRQDGQIKPFQTGFNLIFPNLWAKDLSITFL